MAVPCPTLSRASWPLGSCARIASRGDNNVTQTSKDRPVPRRQYNNPSATVPEGLVGASLFVRRLACPSPHAGGRRYTLLRSQTGWCLLSVFPLSYSSPDDFVLLPEPEPVPVVSPKSPKRCALPCLRFVLRLWPRLVTRVSCLWPLPSRDCSDPDPVSTPIVARQARQRRAPNPSATMPELLAGAADLSVCQVVDPHGVGVVTDSIPKRRGIVACRRPHHHGRMDATGTLTVRSHIGRCSSGLRRGRHVAVTGRSFC